MDTFYNDIPEHIYKLPKVQLEIKKLICSDAAKEGKEDTAYQYGVCIEKIEKWQDQINLQGEEYNSEVQSQNASKYILSQKRIHPDDEYTPRMKEYVYGNNQNKYYENSTYLKNYHNVAPEQARITPKYQKYPRPQIQNKKDLYIFSLLNIEEKNRILYDFLLTGSGISSRKWGISKNTLHTRKRTLGLGNNKEFRNEWMEKEKAKQERRIEELENDGLEALKLEIEGILKDLDMAETIGTSYEILEASNNNQNNLEELCLLALGKGIANISTRFMIELHKLEHLTHKLCPQEWDNMIKNDWYLKDTLTDPEKLSPEEKLEVIKVYRSEGVMYAAKKYHLTHSMIFSFNSLYSNSGLIGLQNRSKNTITHAIKEKIILYLEDGFTVGQAAEKFNISERKIARWKKLRIKEYTQRLSLF